VWAIIVALALAAGVIWFRMDPAGHRQIPVRVGLVAFFVIALCADVLCIHFEYRHEAHLLSFAEVATAIGLCCGAPLSVLVGALAGRAVALALVRRQPATKLCFNVVLRAVELGVAFHVFGAAVGHAGVASPRMWATAFVAILAANLVTFVAILLVIRVSSGPIELGSVLTVGTLNAAVSVANTALGLIAVLVLSVDARATALLVVMVGILAAVYRGYSTVRQRYANLRLLYEFSEALATARPGDDVVRRILEQSATLVRAEDSELTLPVGSGWVRLYVDGDGELRRDHLVQPDGVAAAVFSEDGGVVFSAHASNPLIWAATGRPIRDAVGAPLVTEDGRAGALVAANRDSDVRTFDNEDLALFQALANHASVALRNAQLVERLTEEAAHRAHQALHDALTGLGNRELFAERVKAALTAQRGDVVVAVMLMDLDEFKEINDTLGHHTGDTVLREIADRLSRTVGLRGTVARLGGDEFAVCIPGCRSAAEALNLAQAIRRTVEQPLMLDELVLEVHASVGVALWPEHGDDPSALLQRADVAMYSAKSSRRGVEVYAASNDHYSQRRLALAGELRQAIAAGGLALHFQPKVSVSDGCVTGAEALVRWHHPRHGWLPPDEFIPVAEQSGLIQPLTRWVLGQALEQVAQWRRAGKDIAVAVNLSARSLMDSNLVDDIARALSHADVPPSALVLELTESTVMSDPDRSQIALQQLADLGCRLSIDDFGTGYSSLSRLKQLPVDEVKIDKSFVLHMATDAEDSAIVRSIIDLARNLGLQVVAEGVEDQETADNLRSMGCYALQGFFLCRPAFGPDVTDWIATQPVRPIPRLLEKSLPSLSGAVALWSA